MKKGLDHLKPHIEENPTQKTEHEKNPSNLKKRMKDLLPIQNINNMSINEWDCSYSIYRTLNSCFYIVISFFRYVKSWIMIALFVGTSISLLNLIILQK